MVIIGLIGNKRVGKDTIADYLVSNYNFEKYSFANPIKDISKILFDWDNDELNNSSKDIVNNMNIKPREFFEWLGTEIMQYKFHDKFPNININNKCIWAQNIYNNIKKKINNSNKNIVITDFRFIHELNYFLDKFGNDIKFILISNNTNIKNINFKNTNNNELQNFIKYNKWDYEIENILYKLINLNNITLIPNINTIEKLYYYIDNEFKDLGTYYEHLKNYNGSWC